MISLEWGITFLPSEDGLIYDERKDLQVFLVTEFSQELNSIRNCFVVANSVEGAMKGVDKNTSGENGYKSINAKSLYEMLLALKEVTPE